MDTENNWDCAWLDEMYNNRARVTKSEDYLQNWHQRSVALRERLMASGRAQLNIAYGTGSAQTLDIFQPATSADPVPVLVYIHGGYWSALDKDDHSFLAEALCERGICLVVVNYSLCPQVGIPDIIQEVAHATRWVYQNIQDYGGDRRRITLAGHSAGGHLAAMMQTQNWRALGLAGDVLPFRNALSISGLFDLAPIMRVPFLQSLQLTPAQVSIASPILHRPHPQSIFYTVAGGNESEEFLRQNRLIQTVWGEKVVPLCESIPAVDHFTIVDSLTSPDSRLYQIVTTLVS